MTTIIARLKRPIFGVGLDWQISLLVSDFSEFPSIELISSHGKLSPIFSSAKI